MCRLPSLIVLLITIAGCDHGPSGDDACGGERAPAWRNQCGPTLDFEAVNQYSGPLAFIHDREDAVALIDGSCTGTLVNAGQIGPLILTAGHCVTDGGTALVVFNHEMCSDGAQEVIYGSVVEVSRAPDYALIELAQAPSILPTPLGSEISADLVVIQHPRGQAKVIAQGELSSVQDGKLWYENLDTLVGSSGAGILNDSGELIGIHTDGDCQEAGGRNMGWTAAAILASSALLRPASSSDAP